MDTENKKKFLESLDKDFIKNLENEAIQNSRKFGFDKSGVLTKRRNSLKEIFEDKFSEIIKSD